MSFGVSMGYYLSLTVLILFPWILFYFCWCGSFPENSLSQLILLHLLYNRNVHTTNPKHCYFVPCAYFLLRGCTEL